MILRVLVTGANGQLGRALVARAPPQAVITALDVSELDISDPNAVRDTCRALAPAVIINAAAYTAVDRAETEVEMAYAVNRDGARHLAEAAAEARAHLVQASTDFVFGGEQGRPYLAADTPRPLGVYGASKLAGEQAVQETAARALILRTAWVYAADGQNFARTMLRLMRQKKPLRVVADQVGTPTWATGLAQAIWRGVEIGLTGVHHWTDAGVASWYDFAVAIQEEALALGLLRQATEISPIPSADYPTAAARPAFSVLDKTTTWQALGVVPPHWRANLRHMLREVAEKPELID